MLHASTRCTALAIAVASLLLPACDRDRDAPPPASSAPTRVEPAAPHKSAAPAGSAPPAAAVPGSDADAEPPELVPPGSPMIPLRQIELAVYLKGPATPALVSETEQKVHARFPALKLLTKPEPAPPPTVVVFAPEMEGFDLPNAAELGGFARELRPAQVEVAALSKGAVLFGWLLDGDPKLAELRKAQDVVLEVAQKAGGFVWDEGSHELFSPQSWKTLRVDGWQGDIPDTRRQYSTRYYSTDKRGARGRAVTLGLAKLGLPDLVVEDIPVMQSAAAVTLMGAVAQLLAEGALVGPEGRLSIDLKAIRHPAARAAIVSGAAANAPLHGSVTLAAAEPEEGDAENRLAEVRFDGYPGASAPERQAAAVRAILGAVPERMAGQEGADPELRAIAQRVQGRLPALAASFQKGLPAHAELYVKVPYAMEGESFDWRWISVAEWKGTTVRGILRDEPADTQARDVGEPVEASQSSIADYLLRKADGTQEGGESLKGLAGRPAPKK